MPLFIPILIGMAVAGVGGAGLATGLGGVSDMKKAAELGERAERRHRRHKDLLEECRERTSDEAASYGKRKIEVRTTSFKRLVEVMTIIGRRCSQQDLHALSGVEAHIDVIEGFRAQYLEAETTLRGLLVAGVASSAAAPATYMAVGLVGAASTGTAIGSLSGAAASSATLAWLGGGALAAGGWGMAGGAVVLGGIVAAPALLVGGFALAVQGEKALTKAVEYEASVERAVDQMDGMMAVLRQVRNRVNELSMLLDALDRRLDPLLCSLESVASYFDIQNAAHMQLLRESMQLAMGLSEIMKVPVLDEQGSVSVGSGQVVAKYRLLSL